MLKDRTMILPAVLFLILTVGAGVNLSLEACSRMVGRPLAPGLVEVYRRYEPAVSGTVKQQASEIKAEGALLIARSYPAVARKVELLGSSIKTVARTAVFSWRERLSHLVETVRGSRVPQNFQTSGN